MEIIAIIAGLGLAYLARQFWNGKLLNGPRHYGKGNVNGLNDRLERIRLERAGGATKGDVKKYVFGSEA